LPRDSLMPPIVIRSLKPIATDPNFSLFKQLENFFMCLHSLM